MMHYIQHANWIRYTWPVHLPTGRRILLYYFTDELFHMKIVQSNDYSVYIRKLLLPLFLFIRGRRSMTNWLIVCFTYNRPNTIKPGIVTNLAKMLMQPDMLIAGLSNLLLQGLNLLQTSGGNQDLGKHH